MSQDVPSAQSAKQGFERFLQPLKVAIQEKGKKLPPVLPLPQINYFEVDDKTGKYVRVYAPLVSLAPHELRVKIGSDEYVLPSAVDLTTPGGRIGNILRFFAYAPDPAPYKQLFPLPESALTPPAEAAKVEFPKQADKEREALIEGHPAVKDARKGYNAARDGFVAAMHDLVNFVAEQAKLGKNAPGLQGLLEPGSADKVVACVREKELPAAKQDLRPRVAIAPPEEVPAPLGKKAAMSQKKSKIKVPKKRSKDHERTVRQMFPREK